MCQEIASCLDSKSTGFLNIFLLWLSTVQVQCPMMTIPCNRSLEVPIVVVKRFCILKLSTENQKFQSSLLIAEGKETSPQPSFDKIFYNEEGHLQKFRFNITSNKTKLEKRHLLNKTKNWPKLTQN